MHLVGIPAGDSAPESEVAFRAFAGRISSKTNLLAYSTTSREHLRRSCQKGIRFLDEIGIAFVSAPARPRVGEICDASFVWSETPRKRTRSVHEVFERLMCQIQTHYVAQPADDLILFRPGDPSISDDLAKKWINTFPTTRVYAADSPVVRASQLALAHFQKCKPQPESYVIHSAYEVLRDRLLPSPKSVLIVTSVQQGYNLYSCLLSLLMEHFVTHLPPSAPVVVIKISGNCFDCFTLTLADAALTAESLSKARSPLTLAVYVCC